MEGVYPAEYADLSIRSLTADEAEGLQEQMEKNLEQHVDGFTGVLLLDAEGRPFTLKGEGPIRMKAEGELFRTEETPAFMTLLENGTVGAVSGLTRMETPEGDVYYEFAAGQFGALLFAIPNGEPLEEPEPEPDEEPEAEIVGAGAPESSGDSDP